MNQNDIQLLNDDRMLRTFKYEMEIAFPKIFPLQFIKCLPLIYDIICYNGGTEISTLLCL